MLVNAGIESSHLRAKGFEDALSITANANKDSKAKNRRVELVKL